MKKFLLLAFVLLSAIRMFALDEVILKDGTKYEGVVVEGNEKTVVKFMLPNGTTKFFMPDEISVITIDPNQTEKSAIVNPPKKEPQNVLRKGYRGFADISWGMGSVVLQGGGFGEDGNIMILTTHGYQFNSHLFVGAGVGVGWYYNDHYGFGAQRWGQWHEYKGNDFREGYYEPTTSSSQISIPLFADVRYNILKGNISPFADIKVGYSVAGATGLYLNPMVGVRFGLSRKVGFNIGVAFLYQKYVHTEDFDKLEYSNSNSNGYWEYVKIGTQSMKVKDFNRSLNFVFGVDF